MNYYNDNDKHAAQWLRNLITTGLIPPGDVDGRSIIDVQASDLIGYTQCHFFAGIGGWSEALRLAQWGADRTVWSGSCPCQSLSVAGLGKGAEDERHLWPEFARLIFECRPSTVFGEQVASKSGREWLSGIRLDLVAMGYAVGAADLPAASCSAPHKRNRLFWVADAECDGRRADEQEWKEERRVADGRYNPWYDSILIPCADGKWRRVPGRQRKVEPALFPLASGLPGRVGVLRGAGNSIVPQVAAEFIKAYLKTQDDLGQQRRWTASARILGQWQIRRINATKSTQNRLPGAGLKRSDQWNQF